MFRKYDISVCIDPVFILENGTKAKIVTSINDIPKENRVYHGEYMSTRYNWYRVYSCNNDWYALKQ